MEKGQTKPYGSPCVSEAYLVIQSLEPKDDFGYPQTLPRLVGSAATTPEISNNGRDYTKQLQFHEAELAQAEQRGFPPGQVEYHAGKIAVYKALL